MFFYLWLPKISASSAFNASSSWKLVLQVTFKISKTTQFLKFFDAKTVIFFTGSGPCLSDADNIFIGDSFGLKWDVPQIKAFCLLHKRFLTILCENESTLMAHSCFTLKEGFVECSSDVNFLIEFLYICCNEFH